MHLKIRHQLSYSYEHPVQLGLHRICMRPRPVGFLRLLSHTLRFNPEPSLRFSLLAASGDQIEKVRFFGNTDRFDVVAESEVINKDPENERIILIRLKKNSGVGAAVAIVVVTIGVVGGAVVVGGLDVVDGVVTGGAGGSLLSLLSTTTGTN